MISSRTAVSILRFAGIIAIFPAFFLAVSQLDHLLLPLESLLVFAFLCFRIKESIGPVEMLIVVAIVNRWRNMRSISIVLRLLELEQ